MFELSFPNRNDEKMAIMVTDNYILGVSRRCTQTSNSRNRHNAITVVNYIPM